MNLKNKKVKINSIFIAFIICAGFLFWRNGDLEMRVVKAEEGTRIAGLGDNSTLTPLNNTAEVLMFTPSGSVATSQNQLLKGIAEISDDGGRMWQRSIAEVLYVGATPIILDVSKDDGVNFLNSGAKQNI